MEKVGEAMEVGKVGEAATGDATTGEAPNTEAPTSGNAESKEIVAEDKGAEDFEMVEGGGEDDQLAQEKAVEKGEGNGDVAITDAEQPKEDVVEPMGNFLLAVCLLPIPVFQLFSVLATNNFILPLFLTMYSNICLFFGFPCLCNFFHLRKWANITLDEKE
jgi:hypothetical protein